MWYSNTDVANEFVAFTFLVNDSGNDHITKGSTLTAARLPGATKNFIGATKFQILIARSGN